jgi:glycosyltransferase involved in cell wall biosynthesis
MACGTPVIAFNRGSMPELIENGKNGFLVSNVDEAVDAVARIQKIDRDHVVAMSKGISPSTA